MSQKKGRVFGTVMVRFRFNALMIAITVLGMVGGNVYAQDTVDATTLNCKYMFGYQGWQRTSGDGCGNNWFHWTRNSAIPNGTNMTVDLFPDLTECSAAELTATNMHYSNGSVVGLYSTCNETTIMRHWKWMKDYQVDGAWVQRFGPKHVGWTESTNKTLLSCKKAAETYGRVFVVMYDVSGASNATLFNNITTDWMYLVDTFKVTASPRYLKHKGKPLVSVWGFGFPDRSITAAVATQIVNWFKTGAPAKYQATVMAGVISSGDINWRTMAEPWASAIRTADIISPWFVGSFNNVAGADGFNTNRVIPDLAECKTLGKDYLPVVWPGFSWSNMHSGSTPQNMIPRLGGALYWEQVYNCINSGATMLYNAMFDEIDEGTAMLKACPKRSLAPNEGYWLTLDADGYTNLPSDWYLRLAGCAKKVLCNPTLLTKAMPLNPNNPTSIKPEDIRISRNLSGERMIVRGGMLEVKLGAGEKGRVVFYKIDGREQKEFECRDNGGTSRISLFTQGDVADGTYLLQLKLDNGIVENKVIAITR
jgi:hypothetical protein